jgi:hypothetical protein
VAAETTPPKKENTSEAASIITSFLQKYPSFHMAGTISSFRPDPKSGQGLLIVSSAEQSFCFRYRGADRAYDNIVKDGELLERERDPKTGKVLEEKKSKDLSNRLIFTSLLAMQKLPAELVNYSFQPKTHYRNKLNYITLTPRTNIGNLEELTLAFNASPRPDTLSMKTLKGAESFWKIEEFRSLSKSDFLKHPCWLR